MLSSVLMDDDEVKHDEQDEDDLEASSAPSRSKNEQKRKKKKKVKKGESKTNEDDADGGVGDDPFDDLDDILAEFNPNKCKYALLLISFLHFPCLFHLSPPPPIQFFVPIGVYVFPGCMLIRTCKATLRTSMRFLCSFCKENYCVTHRNPQLHG